MANFRISTSQDNVTLVKNSIVTNVKEELRAPDIKLYPNPASRVIHFTHEVSCLVKVVSLSGEIIVEKELFRTRELDLGKINAGVYLVQLANESKVQSFRIMVK